MFDVFGDFELWNVFYFEKHCGSFRGFGTKGIMGSRIDYTQQSCLEFLSNLWEETCWNSRVNLYGDFVVGYELSFQMKQPVDS
jgi:hypothetical protein